jgi:ferrochelatase
MNSFYDAVLLIAFGGPTSPDEIRPFLARVLKGVAVPPERVDEVVRHYEAVGGRSPINDITFRQATALEKFLAERGKPLPVYIGMRNSRPFLTETLERMNRDGIERVLGFILSAHRTEASWERYMKNVADARNELGIKAPEINYCAGWHNHPLFVRVWVEQIQTSFAQVPHARRQTTPLVFTAHSVPVEMAARSPYVEQLRTTARLIVEELGQKQWQLAYQSRSGQPADPWLEPDIAHVIRDLAAKGTREIAVAPIGFVCDHVEVLYDLDIEAAKTAADLGAHLIRVSCPNDHPTFIRMMADVIERKLQTAEDRG